MSQTKLTGLLLVVVVLLSSTFAFAQSVDPQSTLIPIQMKVLDNGLRVIVKEIPSYPIATVNVWVNVGAKNDPEGYSGLAHFFEHLLFKGTTTRPPGQIAYEVESLGGYLNAMTSLDYTTYFIVVPSEYVDKAMEVQADAIRNSVFDQAEIDRERTVIHEEIRLRIDSPQTHLVDMAIRELFPGTVYARPVIGTFEELANVNRREMLDFHAKYYVPNNMVLVVAGNVNAAEVFSQAERLYGDMVPRSMPSPDYISMPNLDNVIYLHEERPIQQSYVFLGHPGPGLNTRDAAALTMTGIILGGGRSSRLYRQLVEEEYIVNSVSASYSGFSEIGLFAIMAQLDPENRDRFSEIVKNELTRLQNELVNEDELSRARTMARSQLAFSTESSTNVAMYLGQMEIYGGVMGAVNRSAILEGITADDIQRAAQMYLDPDAYIYSEIMPVGR